MNIKLQRSIVSLVSMVLLSIVITITYLNLPEAEKVYSSLNVTFPFYTLEEVTSKADKIVHGVVVERGNSYFKKHTNNDDGVICTPITIQVIEHLKGKSKPKYITYHELGGETRTKKCEVYGLNPLKTSDEVVIFLNQYNFSYGFETIINVHDQNVQLTKGFLNDEAITEISLEELKEQIKSYNNE